MSSLIFKLPGCRYNKPLAIAISAAFLLSACVPTQNAVQSRPADTAVNSLAQTGRTSPEAVKLQANTAALTSLENQQKAATKRVASYGTQGAVAGAVVGGLLGYLACANCNDQQRAAAVVAGAGGGGYAGHKVGENQAKKQNEAAAKENALQERIAVASQQLSQSQSLREQADRILAYHQKTLAQVKAQVQAGKVSVAKLEAARANAAADAQQIHAASKVLSDTTASIKTGADQDKSGQLTAAAASTQKDLDQTDVIYSTLVSGIKQSAL